MAYKVYDPAYLNGLHKPLTEEELSGFRKLKNGSFRNNPEYFQWLKKLCDIDGTTQFRIKYFGEIHPDFPFLIVGKNFNTSVEEYTPPRIVAENANTGNEILLFDLALHGYNAVFCGEYEEFLNTERNPDRVFADLAGSDLFEVFISVNYHIDFDEEFTDDVDEDGNIETQINKIPFETAKSNSFDYINIYLKNNNNEWLEIVSFELA